MTTSEFLIVWLACLAAMLLCRCIPIFVLKERELPPRLESAINLIPPAAFAALVTNDLFKPTMFDNGYLSGLVPIFAALIVVAVAHKTRSLIWCAIVGVIAYAIMLMLLHYLY